MCIDKYGFASKKNSGDDATAYHILDSFEVAGKDIERFEPSDEAYSIAVQLIESMKTMEVNSTFDGNIVAIAGTESGWISRKHIPYIVAATGMMYRKGTEGNGSNEWIGTIGDSISVEVKVENIKHVKGMYGVQTLYEMSDCNGNKVVWFTSREKYSIGDRLNIVNGTIKKHSEYKGVKSTVIGGRGMKVTAN